jgi:hypothetical protein
MTTKRCERCRETKDIEEFSWKYKVLGIRQSACKECMKWYAKRYFKGSAHDEHLKNIKERKKVAREVARQYVWDYLSNHPCVSCGEDDPRVLEFHHKDSAQKERDLSRMVGDGLSTGRLQQEMDKCIVLCGNCHKKVTMSERGHWRSRK